jgi:hypothetical protein
MVSRYACERRKLALLKLLSRNSTVETGKDRENTQIRWTVTRQSLECGTCPVQVQSTIAEMPCSCWHSAVPLFVFILP